jgi:hypothetical protein
MSYNDKLGDGRLFQDFVMDILAHEYAIIIQNYGSMRYQFDIGENIQGWEIKLDRRITDTKRLSIEIAEKTRGTDRNWIPSGIYRPDNGWLYIQGNYDHLWVFMKHILVLVHQGTITLPELHIVEDATPTIRKFYIPLRFADILGKRIVIPPRLHPNQRFRKGK